MYVVPLWICFAEMRTRARNNNLVRVTVKNIENKALLLHILLIANLFVVFTLPIAWANRQGSQIIPSQGTISMDGMLTPVLSGWGGIRLFEATLNPDTDPDNPDSSVFAGEQSSNAEMVMRRLKNEGFNAIRALFESDWGENAGDEWYQKAWQWNPQWFERYVTLAKHYDLWVIVDYHGYREPYQHEEEWISFWQNLISTYSGEYDKFIWGMCNEPITPYSGQQAIDEWTRRAQRWIDMCRGLGDTHWIVVSEVCWGIIGFPPVEWFPDVTDPLNRVFLDKHFYYDYGELDDKNKWTVEDAEAKADYYYNLVIEIMNRYNRPFLCTEMGAWPGGVDPPDVIYNPHSWSPVSLAFIQRLIDNFDAHTPRIGYILWQAGDWGPAGLYGDWDCWGTQLEHESFGV